MLASLLLRSSLPPRSLLSSSTRRCFSAVHSLEDNAAVKAFVSSNPKAVLYFTATWCPPCKTIKPVYEELSAKHTGVKFGKVDVDANPDAAGEAAISAVPTFLFVKDEEIVDRFSSTGGREGEGEGAGEDEETKGEEEEEMPSSSPGLERMENTASRTVGAVVPKTVPKRAGFLPILSLVLPTKEVEPKASNPLPASAIPIRR